MILPVTPGGNNEGPPSFYLLNNIGRNGSTYGGPLITPTKEVNDAGEIAMTNQGYEGGDQGGAMPNSWFRSTPDPAQQFPITADDVNNLDAVVLPTVGNSQHLDCNGNWASDRDSQDARVIAQYQNHSGGNLFAGQYTSPPVAAGTACSESLHDGIPDQWKTAKGLSTKDPNIFKSTAPNGYTWLENYLNGQ